MPSPIFEIGVVYKKNSRYYLAVSERLLVSLRNNKLVEIKPYVRYNVVRQMSVEELCRRWKISLAQIDQISRNYFAPSPAGIKIKVEARSAGIEEDRGRHVYRIMRLAG